MFVKGTFDFAFTLNRKQETRRIIHSSIVILEQKSNGRGENLYCTYFPPILLFIKQISQAFSDPQKTQSSLFVASTIKVLLEYSAQQRGVRGTKDDLVLSSSLPRFCFYVFCSKHQKCDAYHTQDYSIHNSSSKKGGNNLFGKVGLQQKKGQEKESHGKNLLLQKLTMFSVKTIL